MALIDDATLADLRELEESAMPDSAVILSHNADSIDPEGSTTATYTAQAPIKALVSGLTLRDAQRAQSMRVEADVKLGLPAFTLIKNKDRVRVTQAESGLVRMLEVTSVNMPSYETSRQVLCKEYQ